MFVWKISLNLFYQNQLLFFGKNIVFIPRYRDYFGERIINQNTNKYQKVNHSFLLVLEKTRIYAPIGILALKGKVI